MEQWYDVDDIYRSLGTWGRYQLGQLTIMWLAMIPCVIHLMSVVFIGYRPHYQCNVDTATNLSYTATTDQCHVTVHYNHSNVTSHEQIACQRGFSFDEQNDISIVTEWNLVCDGAEQAELSQSLLMLGQGLGGFIFTGLSDKYGRKPIHVFSHLALFVLSLATAFIPTIELYSTLKFFTGMMIEGLLLTSATQYVETLPLEWRFVSESVGLLTWTTGVIMVTPFAYLLRHGSWRYLQAALALLSVYSLVEYWLFDESLRWLMANGKLEEAERVVRKAARRNNIPFTEVIDKVRAKAVERQAMFQSNTVRTEAELNSLDKDDTAVSKTETTKAGYVAISQEYTPESSKVEKYTMFDILKDKRILLNSIIIWFAWITNSLTYYGLGLTSASLFGNRYVNYFLVGVVEYGSAFTEFMLLNRIGRKKTVMLMFTISATGLLCSTMLSTYADDNKTMLIFSVVFYLIGKLAITAAFSGTFLYTPELYPTNLRNAGYGFCSVFARVGGVLAPFAGLLAEKVQWGPGVVFCAMCALSCIAITRLPETMGRELPTTIDELKAWYKENTPGFKSRKKKKLTNSKPV